MTVTVRQATTADIEGIFRAWQEMRDHNASLDRRIQLVPVNETEFALALREVMQRATSVVLVAEREAEIAGFVTASIEQNQPDRLPERHATIGYIYVLPAHRRKGVAAALIASLRQWAAKQDGVHHIEMTVLANDGAAAGFWSSAGFTPFIERLWAPVELAEPE